MNPWREGDFLVYAEAKPTAEGMFEAWYRVDHHPEGGPPIRTAVLPRQFGTAVYKTAGLAMTFAIHAGQEWVRTLRED